MSLEQNHCKFTGFSWVIPAHPAAITEKQAKYLWQKRNLHSHSCFSYNVCCYITLRPNTLIFFPLRKGSSSYRHPLPFYFTWMQKNLSYYSQNENSIYLKHVLGFLLFKLHGYAFLIIKTFQKWVLKPTLKKSPWLTLWFPVLLKGKRVYFLLKLGELSNICI